MSAKEDKDIQIQIWKDVTRTHQDNEFFRQKDVKQALLDLLYIWARENLDYKYQQGMNELFAAVVSCVFSELDFSPDESDNELTPEGLFLQFHSYKYAWADSYCLFARLMNLGIKELYYKEEDPKAALSESQFKSRREHQAHVDA